ncbi:Nucleotide-diphospho-sugar transferase [Phytophthora cactorum]|nr:Nucleotide-diphospho-sugar transferase [Phytophthora cactorum]
MQKTFKKTLSSSLGLLDLVHSFLQSSLIARRWLTRGLVVSIFLYGLLLLAVWSDIQHLREATSDDLQLIRSDIDAELKREDNESIAIVNSIQLNSTNSTSTRAGISFEIITNIKAGASGYCLLKNEATGEEVQVMRVNCSSMRDEIRFNCRQAADFARVAPQIDALIAAKQQEVKQNEDVQLHPTNGVLMVMYPKLLASVYSTVRLLRTYNCSLPVELWYLENEMGTNPLNESRVLQSLVKDYGPISLRGIAEADVDGFNTKVFALVHSELDQVLFLDADNSPVRDPTYLFSTPEFVEKGTIFWPDFWHPMNTIFNINKESLLWELVGTPYVDMFEQESGQLLIDRRRSDVALKIVQFLALRKPDHFERFKLLHGDKDLFRLAWLKTNTSFYMIQTPAAAAGLVKGKQFCGMTMVQHDPQGDILFLHHNGKKLIGEEETSKTRVWTHLQSFVFPKNLASVNVNTNERYEYMATNYHVRIVGGGIFRGFLMCYGDTVMESEHFKTTSWGDLPFKDLDDQLHDLAQEAGALAEPSAN